MADTDTLHDVGVQPDNRRLQVGVDLTLNPAQLCELFLLPEMRDFTFAVMSAGRSLQPPLDRYTSFGEQLVQSSDEVVPVKMVGSCSHHDLEPLGTKRTFDEIA